MILKRKSWEGGRGRKKVNEGGTKEGRERKKEKKTVDRKEREK